MSVELEEFEPGRFRVKKDRCPHCRSDLPMPMVISDSMPPTEQVDGRFYESKSAFRAVGRANGLTEVGNEKPKPRTTRPSQTREARDARRASLKKAIEQVRAGNINTKTRPKGP
jgi:hypothetical protein